MTDLKIKRLMAAFARDRADWLSRHLGQLTLSEFVEDKNLFNENRLTTWIPENSIIIFVEITNCRKILLHTPSGRVYHATDDFSLPQLKRLWGTVLLARYTEDSYTTGVGGLSPRILIQDIVFHHGKTQNGRDPNERYDILKQLGLHSDAITVQWAGFRYAAETLLSDSSKLPHKVSKLCVFTENPLEQFVYN